MPFDHSLHRDAHSLLRLCSVPFLHRRVLEGKASPTHLRSLQGRGGYVPLPLLPSRPTYPLPSSVPSFFPQIFPSQQSSILSLSFVFPSSPPLAHPTLPLPLGSPFPLPPLGYLPFFTRALSSVPSPCLDTTLRRRSAALPSPAVPASAVINSGQVSGNLVRRNRKKEGELGEHRVLVRRLNAFIVSCAVTKIDEANLKNLNSAG